MIQYFVLVIDIDIDIDIDLDIDKNLDLDLDIDIDIDIERYITHLPSALYEWRTKLYVKLDAIHKLGSSPIGCEDFSMPGSITNGVSV